MGLRKKALGIMASFKLDRFLLLPSRGYLPNTIS